MNKERRRQLYALVVTGLGVALTLVWIAWLVFVLADTRP